MSKWIMFKYYSMEPGIYGSTPPTDKFGLPFHGNHAKTIIARAHTAHTPRACTALLLTFYLVLSLRNNNYYDEVRNTLHLLAILFLYVLYLAIFNKCDVYS